MKIFGIPISGMMYYMNWTLTNAQIELISSDVSVVDYNYNKNSDKKKHKKGEYDNTKADSRAVKKAGDEWLKKYGNTEGAGQGLSIGDILGNSFKADVGVKLE